MTDLRFQSREEARAMVTHLTDLCYFLRDRLEVPLLLENMDYMGRDLKPGYGVFRTSVEPALMWQLVEEAGVGVMLDLAHLRVTADQRGGRQHCGGAGLDCKPLDEGELGQTAAEDKHGLTHPQDEKGCERSWRQCTRGHALPPQ